MPQTLRLATASTLNRRGRRAYTLIELLTVIAIIGIVTGIIVVSLRSVSGSSQKRQTVVLLERLNNALVEMTNSPAGAQKLYTIQLPSIYYPGANLDFTQPAFTGINWIGVPASAVESQFRSARVINEIVASTPAGKAILEDLPPERRLKMTFTAPLITPNREYLVPLDAWGNPIVFVFDGLKIATGTNVGRPFTVDLGAGPETEVGGLTNIYSESEKSFYEPANAFAPAPTYGKTGILNQPNPSDPYDRATNAKFTAYNPRTGPTNLREQTLRSPDRRPFWMSAGPDGKYETHDDNVYSFGN